MGLAAIKVTNNETHLRPTQDNGGTAITDQALAVTDTAKDLIATALNPATTHVEWTLDAADVRMTFDGSAPTATNGHLFVNGTSRVWHRKRAEACKVIRGAATNGYIHITELSA